VYADLLGVDGLALVSEGRVAGDHETALDARQLGGQILGHPVGVIILRRIAGSGRRATGERVEFRTYQGGSGEGHPFDQPGCDRFGYARLGIAETLRVNPSFAIKWLQNHTAYVIPKRDEGFRKAGFAEE
jgi:hypothetical protein